MWVELTNQATGKAYPVQSRLYLRGAVVTHYEWSPRGSRWRADIAGPWSSARGRDAPNAFDARDRIAPGRSSRRRRSSRRKSPSIRWSATSCSAFGRRSPISGISGSWSDRAQGRLLREEGYQDSRFHLQAGHDGLRRRPDGAARAVRRSRDGRDRQRSAGGTCRRSCNCPTSRTRSNLRGNGWRKAVWPRTIISAAQRMLEEKFLASGEFKYSLQPQPRNARLDPIEDFVLNNRRGHCEYFADRLGVDASQPGDSVARGPWIQVRRVQQPPQGVPGAASGRPRLGRGVLAAGKDSAGASLGDARRWTHGAWLRLDPTPGGDADAGVVVRKLGAGDRLDRVVLVRLRDGHGPAASERGDLQADPSPRSARRRKNWSIATGGASGCKKSATG